MPEPEYHWPESTRTRRKGGHETVQLTAHRGHNSYHVDCGCWGGTTGAARIWQSSGAKVHQGVNQEGKGEQGSHVAVEQNAREFELRNGAPSLGQVRLPGGAAGAGGGAAAGHPRAAQPVHVGQRARTHWEQVGQVRDVELGQAEPWLCDPVPAQDEEIRLVAHVHQQTGLAHRERHRAEC